MDDEQLSFAALPFEQYAKTTRRAAFLEEMDRIVPWDALCKVVEPHYPTGLRGRMPVPLERMLRIHFLQQWFALSDPGAEEALHDSIAMRKFAGIDLGHSRVPDETTICKFRHLLEKHGLGKKLFAAVNLHLKKSGVRIATGTIVDATIIAAPSSTKNQEKARDPEMHQTKKGRAATSEPVEREPSAVPGTRLGAATHHARRTLEAISAAGTALDLLATIDDRHVAFAEPKLSVWLNGSDDVTARRARDASSSSSRLKRSSGSGLWTASS